MNLLNPLMLSALLLFFQPNVSGISKESSFNQPGGDDLNLSGRLLPVDTSLFVRDTSWYSWCNSVVKGEDGRYHLFYSRFPKSVGFNSWLVFSEIAHAVGDTPAGPFTYKETILPPRPGAWDQINAHNVTVKRFSGKYYLYYISTSWKGIAEPHTDSTLRSVGSRGYGHPLWMPIRNNQRTGLAVSVSVNGPWQRLDAPIVEPRGPIRNVTVNPAVEAGPDGRYYMMIKGDDVRVASHARLIQAIAASDSPIGPFLVQDKPAFDALPTEDASMWYDRKRGRFYSIFHAHGSPFIGLITSVNGIDWQKASNFVVCKKELPLPDGSTMKVDRMERPSVYVEDGEVKMLSFAVMRGKESFIAFIKLKPE